ncbi:MAG: serine/threonine-protein kinase [Steroidobacter sp.]
MTSTLPDPSEWQALSAALDRAFDLDPIEREQWLCELTVTQPKLAATLRELLAEREALNTRGFLENSPRAIATLAALEHVSMLGKQIGAYTIERLIGRGGMGEVWLASRNDGRFEGRYAIKFLDSLIAQPQLADRFRHEGRLLARLSHPNIGRLLDAGATDDGKQFLVIEYVDGERIDHYCDSHQLSVEGRVRLFLGAVSAVAHAHSHLIIHRDLKPSNVLVTREGTVKLLDFGIAKLLSTGEDQAAVTRIEEIALTPEYAAPEQLMGDVPSTATDVYQLGMLLYVLLAGGHPLQLTGNRADRIRAALAGNVPRASQFANEARKRELRGDLDAILEMALQTEPNHRYGTAAAFCEELVRYLNRQPVNARRASAWYVTRKFMARHRISVIGSSIAMVSLCATLIFAVGQARVASTERDRAFALATRNAAVTEFLGMLITEAAEGDEPVTVADMLARSERLALADTSGSPENRAAVLAMIAARYGSLGDDAKAARLLEGALALLDRSQDHALRSRLTCAHALSIASLGQVEPGIRAIEGELANLGSDSENAAYCLLYRAFIADNADDADNALKFAPSALEHYRAAPRAAAADEGLFLGAVGFGHHLHRRNVEADTYYRMAIDKYVELGREGGPDAIAVRNNWAVSFDYAGRPNRALELYDETLRLVTERNPGSQPPGYLVGNRSRALERVGRYREALESYHQAYELLGRQHNVLGQLYCLLGLAATSQEIGDPAAAGDYLARAKAILASDFPAQSPPWMSRAMVLSHMPARMAAALVQGRVYIDAGRYEEARQQFTQAMPEQGMSASWGLIQIELRTGNPQTALAMARRAVKIAISVQGGFDYSIGTGNSYLLLGRCLQAVGEHAAAQEAFRTAVLHLSNTVDEVHPQLIRARKLAGTN